MSLPETQHLALDQTDGVLVVTFDRADVSNALNIDMVEELAATFAAVSDDREVRAIVLRGAGRHFCAGADLKSIGAVSGDDPHAAVIAFNRRFGEVLAQIDRAPQAVVVVAHGAALGGGFGLLCVADITILTRDAVTGMPETRLGLPAAQIMPFAVKRIGITVTRRIAVCGLRFDGAEAYRLGVAHELVDDLAAADVALAKVIADIRACAPGANAASKALLTALDGSDTQALAERAAELFADCLLGDEGTEGTQAFREKRVPRWAKK